MCGVLFIQRPELEPGALKAVTDRALSALHHRGPDDHGLWIEPGVAIGHRRLAILDLGSSRQPMLSADQRWVLSYNGELYNFRELRSGLASRWRFTTDGDSEVVLAGLALEGVDFLQRMEGMWAIVLWDRSRRELLLARDRMGKKPLYHSDPATITGGRMVAASELPALELAIGTPLTEDPASSADFFRHGYYLPGTTAFTGVREVLPGHWWRWRADDSTVDGAAYWSLSPARFEGSPGEAAEALRGALQRAVERRLVADVEVGAFLSGGVDSSLIVGLMAGHCGVRPHTFTIGFAEQSYDERPHAERVAAHWGLPHHVAELTAWEPGELERLLRHHVGQPFADSSLLPTAEVSRITARRVKVALSGDGGDELFSGYQRYQARAILRWYTRLPRGMRALAEGAIRRLPEPIAHHSGSLLKKAHLFLDIVARQQGETPYVAPTFYSPQALSQLCPQVADLGHPAPLIPDECSADDIGRMMTADALVYLPQDILLKVDRASMAHSLECRAPFLDREVVELAFALPRQWHRRGWEGKRMLRAAFADWLPEGIWQRRKQGFAVPVHAWFRGAMAERLRERLADDCGVLERSAVERLLQEHQAGRRDHGYRLWAIHSYLAWRTGR